MRIGIDIRTLMDEKYSGISWCTYNLLQEIFALDHNNEYLLFYNSGRNIAGRMPKFNQPNVKIIATHYPNKIFNYFLQKILHRPKIDELLGGVDVFWSPHLNFTVLSDQTKFLLTVHDLSFLSHPEYFSCRKNWWHQLLGVPHLVNRADCIVAVSENTKYDIIDNLGISKEKVTVISNGAGKEFRRLPPDDEKSLSVKKKYDLPEKFILYCGAIEPRKNITGLIKAFDLATAEDGNLKDYQLVLVGPAGWKNKAVYQAITESPCRGRIKMIGYIEDKERVCYYNLCSMFCYPSFYEGFGLPVLEAMACGAPVITSEVSSLPEITGQAALLVDPNDINSIAAAIKATAAGTKLQPIIAEKGIKQAEKLTWSQAAKTYLDIFNNLKQQ
jgi:glycosyltransferase involved in cell wall biosynthesis